MKAMERLIRISVHNKRNFQKKGYQRNNDIYSVTKHKNKYLRIQIRNTSWNFLYSQKYIREDGHKNGILNTNDDHPYLNDEKHEAVRVNK